ncbi:MAG: O-antigen ligase family protein [Oligoflexales bacterium]|nr:O-antigen ligase family protein [Oligoflexales bacterium]
MLLKLEKLLSLTVDQIRFYIVCCMFFFIFYQKVFVIDVGGSIKIYEVLALLLLLLSSCLFLDFKVTKVSIALFLFFVLSPLVSLICFYFIDGIDLFYLRFPEAEGIFRYNYRVSPWLNFLNSLSFFAVLYYISHSHLVFLNKKKMIWLYLVSGGLISIYALYGYFFVYTLKVPDLIPEFLDYRNSKPVVQIRPAGFSSEPGVFFYMLAWSILYLSFSKVVKSDVSRWSLLLLSSFVLYLTRSTAALAFLVPFVFVLLIFEKLYVKILSVFLSIFFLAYLVISGVWQSLIYDYITKLFDYFSIPTATVSSGLFRSYTSLLGLNLFKDYPLFGVGQGNSYYFLWRYEYDYEILNWGERIGFSTPPLNGHIMVLAEQGVFGYFSFTLLFLAFFRSFLKNNDHNFLKIGLIGLFMTWASMVSIFPPSSLFLWIHLALLANQQLSPERHMASL